jgi:hypothetical protein
MAHDLQVVAEIARECRANSLKRQRSYTPSGRANNLKGGVTVYAPTNDRRRVAWCQELGRVVLENESPLAEITTDQDAQSCCGGGRPQIAVRDRTDAIEGQPWMQIERKKASRFASC